MTTKSTVTDAALETMLARRARRADPAGLTDAVFAALETIEPRRGPHLGVPAWWLPGRPNRGFAWVLVAAALLLALLGSALVGARLLDRDEPLTRLEPTGIETMTAVAGADQRVVVDGNGTPWAFWPNHLARYDPTTGGRRLWTLSDGLAFGSPMVAPARAGGVWIWSNTSIRSSMNVRRFTGEGFTDFIPTGTAFVDDFAEAPDGSLWAVSPERGLEHWDGSSWVPAPAGRPTVAAGALLVGRDGDVWVANLEPSVGDSGVVGKGVSHLEGGHWTTYDTVRDMAGLFRGGVATEIEEAADGSIWVAWGDGAIARFDGRAWSRIDGPGFPVQSLDTAPDGTVWVAGAPEWATTVARYANGKWTTYGEEAGVVGAVGPVSATAAGVFLASTRGLLRFDDGRWAVFWPDMAVGPAMAIADRLLAVSADEAWAANDEGIWHYLDGGWSWPMLPAGWSARVHGMALGPDGTLWAATNNGVAALRDGEWTVAWKRAAWSIAVAPDGTAWAGSMSGQVVGLRLDGTPPRTASCPNGAAALAVTSDGFVYVGQFSYSGRPGLARFDGQSCEKVDPIGDGRTVDVMDLVADPTGGLVAVMFRQRSGGTGPTTSYVARLDGERWTILEERTDEGAYLYDGGVTVSPEGEIWRSGLRSGGAALERFASGRWLTVEVGTSTLGPPSIAEDGTLWFVGSGRVQRLRAEDVRP